MLAKVCQTTSMSTEQHRDQAPTVGRLALYDASAVAFLSWVFRYPRHARITNIPHVTPVALATMSPHDALRSGIKLCSSSITIEPTNGQNNNQINRVPGNAR
ncbi:hypothetical protein D3C78_1690490 [compost metagenome]